ncbi:UNVERIFIED_CONTAM: hypothetical protein Sradi_2009600 [Sesamum radiatum]|uniref:DUF4216 domain-containing protein n=1 Tax=Sesamum radiatum TaxID=300843 RepID=A0AAW2TGM4_SESRA
MPKAAYTLTKEQKKKICEWVRSLRFPDGYASNIARCVDIANLRVHGMKSHDCHVFMQKLIPVAFRELLPEFVWSALTQEIGWFTSHYFESHVTCKRHRPSRNDELTQNNDRVAAIFSTHPGRTSGVSTKRYALGQERHVWRRMYYATLKVVAPYYATDFKAWFKRRVEPELHNIEDDLLKSLYWGPNQLVTTWSCYFVNGGMKVHPRYHLVDVNFKRVYQKDEPFILAQQAVQVYYTDYPSMRRDRAD